MTVHDVVLHNGHVVTLDRSSSVGDALAIRGERIAAVGASADLLKQSTPATRKIDLRGRTVIPGFVDAHPHMDREGLKVRGGIAVEGLTSVGELVDAVARAVKTAEPGQWIVLMPMGDPPNDYVTRPDQLKEGRFPLRQDLDAVAPHNPVYIRGVWGWWATPPFPSIANSLALSEAGITRDTKAPHNVEILKDDRGEPNGVFLERNRAPVLEYTLFRRVPRFTYEDRVESVRRASRLYSAAGTTTGYEGHGLTPELIRAYRDIGERDQLTVRMSSPVSVPSASMDNSALDDLLHQWAAIAGGRGMESGPLRIAGVTLDLADPKAAALIGCCYPYVGWAGHFHQGLSDEEFVDLGVRAVRLGLRLNTLVCYDLDRSLRLFEAVDRQVSIRELRCVGIHLLSASDDQLRRIRDLGLVITMTPNILYEHAQSFRIERLGDEAIPIRRVVDAGIPVALSTDNVPYPMLWTLWETLARWNRRMNGPIGESHLSREEALRLCVQTGHYLMWDEGSRGSLETGKSADLVVLGDNPLSCDLDRIPRISVDLTMVDGRIVHMRD
jgi:predicted amidohydrolase YtcJ